MQTISAYLLEKHGLNLQQRRERVAMVGASFDRWLTEKGVVDASLGSGEFESLTPDGGGTYTRNTVLFGDDLVEEIVLREKGNPRQIFVTRVCMVTTEDRVAVYATVSAMNIATTIEPMRTSARCPSIIRDLIRSSKDWTIGDAALPSGRPQNFQGKSGGGLVCELITSARRKFPLVLVSDYEDVQVWDALDRKIASDLAGLAYVASIDDEASWQLSETLGRRFSCFDGAVRIYWPNSDVDGASTPIQSTIWTADRLLSVPEGVNGEDRFREELRRRVMNVSALAITEPPEIGEIYRGASRAKLASLEGDASSLEEIYKMAEEFSDNAAAAKKEVERLRDELEYMRIRAENAESQLPYRPNPARDDLENEQSNADRIAEEEADTVQEGDIIFYKKTYSAPTHDIMVRRGDCGHNSWETANSAHKAWKGVARLEKRDNWKSFLHCPKCSGGGVWKVTW